MKKWMIATSLLAIAVAVPLFCIVAEHITAPAYGNGSIVLLEHLSQSRGRLVNGTYPAPLLMGPGYLYDGYRRLLERSGLDVNDTLKAVVGVAESLSQDAGSGSVGKAYGIYDVPWGAGGITVEGVSPDGTVTLTYNGSQIVLLPGERWETISAESVSSPDYNMRLIKSDLIRNDGFVAKSAIN